MPKKSYISLALSLILIGILVYISNPQRVLEVVSKAKLRYLLLGFSLWLSSIILRTFRWQILLQRVKCEPSFVTSLKVLLAGLAISNLTPGKVGDPIRGYFLKKVTGEHFSRVVPSIFIERILDFFATVLLGSFSLVVLYGTVYFKFFLLGIGFYIFAFCLAIFVLTSEKRTLKAVNLIFSFTKFIPRIREKKSEIIGFSRNLHTSFLRYRKKKPVLLAFIITVGIWLVESLIFYVALLSIGIKVSPFLIMTLNPLIIILSVLTFLPGGLGSGDVLSVVVYSSLTGIAYAHLTAATLLARSISYWPCVAIGLLLAARLKKTEINKNVSVELP
jgi:uncharacterized protein (TIRG00374 family)